MAVIGWLFTWSLFNIFRRPNIHHRTLHCCFRFVDPKVEAQYTQHCACTWRAILRIYCFVVFILAAQELLAIVDTVDPLFWTLLSICLSSFLLFVASYWGRLLPHTLPLLVLYICALGGIFTYQLKLDAQSLAKDTMGQIFDPGTTDLPTYSKTAEMVDFLTGRLLVRDVLLYSFVHWVSLAVAGFNNWTLLAYAAVFVSSIVGFVVDPMVFDKAVGVFYFVVATFAFATISLVMERVRRSSFLVQTQLARELQASQLADSVLNHMLKNTLADVAADIEIFLAGELGPDVLEDAVVCLRRGIRSCRERMVYLKMVAGEYIPVMNAVNLKEFGQQLVAGRNVATHLLDCSVLMDGTLMQLILENAMSNAFKHGHPDHPNVQLLLGLQDPTDLLSRRQIVSFVVKNAAHPSRPKLTDELVQKLFHGEAKLQTTTVIPTLSDGVGVLHCALAARLGGIALSLRQDGDEVMFTASMEVDLPDEASNSSPEDNLRNLASQFPEGLNIFCLDDSASSRRLMEFHLRKWCPTAVVRTYGAVEDDVEVFMADSLQEANIVIMDQNLHFSENYLGTHLCQRLLGSGFAGLICIRSGDDSQDDQARYAAYGAHCSFGKDMLGAKVVQRLKAAYVLNTARVDAQMLSFCVPECAT